MATPELELSDEQREEVRLMLAKFGNKKAKQKQIKSQQAQEQTIADPDPLEEAKPGETVEWTELNAKTRRYAFVRESRALFAPFIIDKIPLTTEELNAHIKRIGMDVTSQNTGLTVCSITQADPVRVFQIQTVANEDQILIETIRYIV